MYNSEIAIMVNTLNEIDKTIHYLYEQCKTLKEENDRLKNQPPG